MGEALQLEHIIFSSSRQRHDKISYHQGNGQYNIKRCNHREEKKTIRPAIFGRLRQLSKQLNFNRQEQEQMKHQTS